MVRRKRCFQQNCALPMSKDETLLDEGGPAHSEALGHPGRLPADPAPPHPCLLRAPAHQQWRGPAAPIRRCRTGHSGHPPAAGGGDSGSSSPKRAEQEGEKVVDKGGNSVDSWMSTHELALEENTIRENCVELGFCTWGQRPAHDSLNSCHPKL